MEDKIKIKHKLFYTLVLMTVCLTALISASVAWFVSSFKVESDTEFKGSAIAAYFAGGDGKENTPYQITEPVHIYNLAWLQYMGIFNADDDNDGNIDMQYYFVLNNDVDMEGLIIPPIGTEENPFVGNFNGQNFCISNATVSNYLSESDGDKGIDKHPAAYTEFDNKIEGQTAAIVGFFGVIGDWDNTIGGLADDSETVEVSSKTNAVYKLYFDHLTVRTETSESLIGLLAGYVSGSIADVGIGSSAIEVGSDVTALNISGLEMLTVVSRYSLIGEYDTETVVWEGKPTPGGWGASVDMKTMYDWVNTDTVRNEDVYYVLPYVSYQKYEERDGVRTLVDETVSNATHNDRVYRAADYGTAGKFSFYYPRENYTYLCGPVPVTKTVDVVVCTDRTADYIYSGNQYLTASEDGTEITSVTSPVGRSGWNFSAEGYLSTLVNGERRYLNFSGGELVLGNRGGTSWTKDTANDVIYCTSGTTRYYLWYSGSAWLASSTLQIQYKISYNNNYLNVNDAGTGLTSDTDESTATAWGFSTGDPNSGSGSIYTITDNGIKYLFAERTGSGWLASYNLLLSENSINWTGSANNRLSVTVSGTVRYLYYQNGWSLDRSSRTLEFIEAEVNVDPSEYRISFLNEQTVEDEHLTTTTENSEVGDPDSTYFPLLTTTDENGNLVVSNGNTGYIVSGSSYSTSTTGLPEGDIRVSRYGKNDIDNSVSSSNSSGVLNNSGVRTISFAKKEFDFIEENNTTLKLEKFIDSAEKFNETLKTGTYVYGLHFMDAQIDKNNLIEIDGAKILGERGVANEYDNYQLPRDAITFNIAESGFVNFFAGTYFYSGNIKNTCFFSFHQVIRDESNTKILDIREIAAIYGVIDNETTIDGISGYLSKKHTFIYEYKAEDDTTYFDGYANASELPEGYELIFDTTWITHPDNVGGIGQGDDISGDYYQYVYYFEIPVNPGEYALGSVEGENGAYLMYLDLAANGDSDVALDPAHTITGVNFADDTVLAAKAIPEDYPVATVTLSHDEGMTAHGGVTLAFNRVSESSLDYQLSGDGAESFTVTYASGDGLSVTAGTVTVLSDFLLPWQYKKKSFLDAG